jgi:tetratricopeptide (TPR) repeat protein/TolB-like protein
MTEASEARRRRIQELLAVVHAAAPGDRAAVLEKTDPDLRQDLKLLLDDISATETVVAGPAADPAHDALGPANRDSFSPGDILSGRFRIVGLIGEGGMGRVYEAEDLILRGEQVALKTLRASVHNEEHAVERLKREIALARRVTHPNVCRVFDVDQHQARGGPITFFTMELLKGDTLAARLRQTGKMSTADARPLLKQMAAALDAAHAAGIVHGDFKPGNVMLAKGPDGRERLVVTDFGLARPAPGWDGATMTLSHHAGGTPAYMAPEQTERGGLTPAADIYALGIVAYKTVTGRLPFDASTPLNLAVQKLRHRPGFQSNDGVDATWQDAISRCLERDPTARFPTANAFIAGLDAPAVSPPRWGRWLAAVAGVAVVAAIAAPQIREPLVRRWVTGAAVSNERVVALLPFTVSSADAESQAYGRGLAAALTDELRQAATIDRQQHVIVIPSAELLEADLTTTTAAQRALGANLILTGRLNRDTAGTLISLNIEGGSRGTSEQPGESLAAAPGSAVLLSSLVPRLARIAGLTLAPKTLDTLKAGGSAQAVAEDAYLQGRGFLIGERANLDAAIAALQKATELDPAYALAHASLGDAYWRKYRATLDGNLLARAQAFSEAAVAVGPGVAYAHMVRGRVHQAYGQSERSIRELQTALSIDPGIVDARRVLAEVYEADGSPQAAEDVYRQEIASYPHYWSPYVMYGSFLIKRGRYREAETSLVDGLKYAPDNSRAIANLAGLYIFTERLAAAEAELLRGVSLKPEAVMCNNLAWVQIYQGKYPEAVRWMEQAVQLPRADSFHWGNLARMYRWAGQPSRAQTTYQKATRLAREELARNPRDARIRGNFAQMLAETGSQSEALVEIAATLERAPKDVSVLFRAALVHELAGDRAAALQKLEAAVRSGYSTVDIRRHPDLARLREDPRFVDIMTLAPKPTVQ